MGDKKQILAFIFDDRGLIGDLSLIGTKISKLKEQDVTDHFASAY